MKNHYIEKKDNYEISGYKGYPFETAHEIRKLIDARALAFRNCVDLDLTPEVVMTSVNMSMFNFRFFLAYLTMLGLKHEPIDSTSLMYNGIIVSMSEEMTQEEMTPEEQKAWQEYLGRESTVQ